MSYTLIPECPEEVVDNRSLYERLQEQKDKKEQEYQDQFALSESHNTHKALLWVSLTIPIMLFHEWVPQYPQCFAMNESHNTHNALNR